ncbi:lipopolysaccharide biosynthesis protein [Pseudactinotalea sp. HY158]|uniref:lipopolysaccharide biosynthesis protein n=1 Tax=Pseudactinotalea sp. HY158 TaxID=2654547 RepID=UPI00129CBF4A|nr:lipopolysaccharide biosynthesis protein [Pseudactinotalea sp. HY158]QGH68495.1 oligosaccharide flippase family protein [Pseudactinotalea sp. HY158]
MRAPATQARPASGGLRAAATWSYALSLGKMVITLGLSLVLAAMLGPRAFGVIAMALVFTNFIEMLQKQGLMPAIISRKVLRDEHADTAFWLVTGFGLVCTAAGIALAPLWAEINGLPELGPVIQVLALTVPLTSTVVVHEALLRRSLEFRKLTIRTWASVIAGGVAGIAAAILGWGVWSLVTQQMVMAAVAALTLWGVSPWRPRLRFSRVAARELRSYSMRSAGSSIGLFVSGRLDIVLAGAFFGPIVIGTYRMGQRLTAMVVDVTARGMQSVSLPGLAEVQDDRDAFSTRLSGMQRITAALAFPLLGLVAGVAPAVEQVLGPEWDGTARAIQLLALVQLCIAATLLLGPALQARGHPGTLAILLWSAGGIKAAALVGAWLLAGGGPDELTALCLAMIGATALSSTVITIVSARTLGIRVRTVARSWVPAGVSAVCTAVAAGAVVHAVGPAAPVAAAGAGGVAGLLCAAATLVALDREVRGVLQRAWRRRPGADRSPRRRADEEVRADRPAAPPTPATRAGGGEA